MRFIETITPVRPLTLENVTAKQDAFAELSKKHGLALLFLYGSTAQNKTRPLSDVDFAMLSKNSSPVPFNQFLEIISDLQKITGREDVDLADLAKASPLLKMEVLREGIPIFVAEEDDLTSFRYQAILRFLDTQPLRDSLSRHLSNACLGRKH